MPLNIDAEGENQGLRVRDAYRRHLAQEVTHQARRSIDG